MDKILNKRYARFFELIANYFSPESCVLIESALELADNKLGSHTRYDGSPLLDHSVKTAEIVISEIGLGRNSTISAIMHDVVRLGMMTPEQVGELYGDSCVSILSGLSNISDVHPKVSDEQAGNFRDLIISYSTDPRVILIKLADRLEVMRSLAIFPQKKHAKKSWESLNLYAQIAHKLGLYSIKSEMEDLSLKFLEPEKYAQISERLDEYAVKKKEFLVEFLKPIENKLKQSGIQYHIKSRTKSIFSIWNKMRKTKVGFDDVYDIFALRIIVDCPPEQEKQQCWGVYSVVSDFYTPNPERMRDWISIPKSNGYESLHTTVSAGGGEWVEIQIRSERMDAVAERGIAAHWRYKGVNQGGMGSEEWLAKLREIIEQTEVNKISETFDSKLSSGEIFVFTPTGDLRKLPEGATVLDFAFDIHSNLGCLCTGGRIKQRIVTIKEVLKNGDIVEVLTSKSQKPKTDWLNFVQTSKARTRIKVYLREEQAKTASIGREELERKIKNWKLSIAIDDAVTELCKFYKLKTGIELYSQVAAQKMDLLQIKEVLVRYLSGDGPAPKIHGLQGTVKKNREVSDDVLVIDEMINNMKYRFGKCCNPIYGDEVFGFITIGTGITIHRNDCPNSNRLKELYPYRVLTAHWRNETMGGSFSASVQIVMEDSPGIVNRVTEAINRDLKINIRSMNFAASGGSVAGTIDIEVTSTQVVDAVVHTLLKIKGVQKAFRS